MSRRHLEDRLSTAWHNDGSAREIGNGLSKITMQNIHYLWNTSLHTGIYFFNLTSTVEDHDSL